jgi:tetratricopeptide (TPR) repeat protein
MVSNHCGLLHVVPAMAVVALSLAGCTTAAPDGAEPSLAIAREHLARYRPQSALRVLATAGATYRRHAEIEYLTAEALYRRGDYTGAAAHYNETLAIAPGHFGAATRLWAARLQAIGAHAVERNKLRAEIDQLARRPGTRAQLLAYWGYYYLWDEAGRQAVLLRAIATAHDSGDRSLLADALRTEINETRSLARASPFATALLDRYTSTTPEPEALAVVFAAARASGIAATRAAVKKYTRRFPNDAFASYYAADVLLHSGDQPSDALAAASHAVVLFEGELARANNAPGLARYYRYWLGRALTVLGRLQYVRGDRATADTVLARATQLNPADGMAFYYRARIAEDGGDPARAVSLLAAALNQTGAPEDAAKRLATLLQRTYHYHGDARDFIARTHGAPRFDDATAAAGLAGVRGRHVAFGDIDNDGDDDLLIDGHRLFRNAGAGVYREVPKALATAPGFASQGGVFADIDRDGDVDLVLWGNRSIALFRNSGNGMFIDASRALLPALGALRPEAVAFGDLDNDGYPDLYIASYQRGGVERGVCEHDRVLHNQDGKRFVTTGGEDFATEMPLCGRGVAWSDVDGDGQQEILVANYRLQPNLLWRRDSSGRWRDVAEAYRFAGVNDTGSFGHSIGVATGDINGDGRMDVVVANLAHPRGLHYSDTSALYPGGRTGALPGAIPFQETDADAVLFDADNDGDLDLLITATYRGHASRLLLNDGAGQFLATGWVAGVDVQNAWGAAAADIDGDGDVDLLIASEDGIRLLRNRGNTRRGLTVRVRSTRCHSNGLGARMRLGAGPTTLLREIQAGRGTGSQDSAAMHFGLGDWRGPVSIAIDDLCGNSTTKLISPTAKTVSVDLD